MKGKTFRIESDKLVNYVEGMAAIEFAGEGGGLQRGARVKVLEKIVGEYAEANPIDDILRKSYEDSVKKIKKDTADQIKALEEDAKKNQARFEADLAKLPPAKETSNETSAEETGKKTGGK